MKTTQQIAKLEKDLDRAYEARENCERGTDEDPSMEYCEANWAVEEIRYQLTRLMRQLLTH